MEGCITLEKHARAGISRRESQDEGSWQLPGSESN